MNENEEKKGWQVKPEEYTRLRNALEGDYASFDDVMIEFGYATRQNGVYAVTEPQMFSFWNEVMGKLEYADAMQNEQIRKNDPKEMEAHRTRVRALGQTMREMSITPHDIL